MEDFAPTWPAGVRHVLQTLESAGYEAYLVGGSVRNWLLGRPVVDFDVTTDAVPSTVQSLFERTVPTGIKHGTVTVLMELPVEVTTYRVDTGYSDGRRPDGVTFSASVEEDLARRDFTMNAIAINLHGQRIDPYHGASDIAHALIRSVGNPDVRFQEDGLRILRGFRFAAELGFSIDEETLIGMRRQVHRLANVSTERVGQELNRIARSGWQAIMRYWSDGPWLASLPEPWALLETGFVWFTGHAERVARWSAEVGDATVGVPDAVSKSSVAPLTVSPLTTRCVAAVATWLRCSEAPAGTGRRLARAVRWPNETARLIEHVETVSTLGLDVADQANWRTVLFDHDTWAVWAWCCIEDWLRGISVHRHRFLELASTQPLFTIRDLALTGADLLATGLTGPSVGQTLQRLSRAVLMGEVANERRPLLAYLDNFIVGGGRV